MLTFGLYPPSALPRFDGVLASAQLYLLQPSPIPDAALGITITSAISGLFGVLAFATAFYLHESVRSGKVQTSLRLVRELRSFVADLGQFIRYRIRFTAAGLPETEELASHYERRFERIMDDRGVESMENWLWAKETLRRWKTAVASEKGEMESCVV